MRNLNILSNIIVSDTGPLIALAILDLLSTLNQLFETIYVPEIVYEEATIDVTKLGAKTIIKIAKHSWFKIEEIPLSDEFEILAQLLDPGEAAVIALAKQKKSALLIDERKGRNVAENHGVAVVGTAAILIKAKNQKLISQVKPLLEKLITHGYRFSPNLIQEVLKRCNENT